MSTSFEPPFLSPNIELFFREQTKRNVSDADRSDRAARARRPIHIVIFIANQLHNQYFDSATAVKMRIQALLHCLVPARWTTYGIFQGQALFQRKTSANRSALPQTHLAWPMKLVTQHCSAVESQLPGSRTFSRSYARIAPVTDVATKSLVQTQCRNSD